MTPALRQAAAKVELITIDSDAPLCGRLCYIGTDNHAAGQEAARLIKAALPGGGKIMMFVGNTRDLNAAERAQGIRDGLAGSNVGVAGVMTDNSDQGTAMANALATLKTRPDIDGYVGLWDYNGPAILRAVQRARKVGSVKIVCWDSDPRTLSGIKTGAIYATLVQQPHQFGTLSAQFLARAVNGDRSWIPASRRIYVPVMAVTGENVESFIGEARPASR
jgi:ribose transport system substrate-binding protein